MLILHSFHFCEIYSEQLATFCRVHFEYLEEINKATGVNIPGSFVDLQNKTVLHDTVIEKDEMKDAVLDSLKIASLK